MFVGEEAQGLMSGGANDPFHVVKDELVAKLESIELRVGQFNGLLYGPGTTAGSKPFRDCRKALGREIPWRLIAGATSRLFRTLTRGRPR